MVPPRPHDVSMGERQLVPSQQPFAHDITLHVEVTTQTPASLLLCTQRVPAPQVTQVPPPVPQAVAVSPVRQFPA